VAVERPAEVALSAPPVTSTAAARDTVLRARARQAVRLAGTGTASNADMPASLVTQASELPAEAREALRAAYATGKLSARGHSRVLRVARTIADLAGAERIATEHLFEAIALRRSPDLETAEARAA
jgi:magnesium chelatase family protein